MSGLKSAWEISLEKSNELNPELKNRKKLTKEQKAEIAEIRKDGKATIADKDVTLDFKIKKLPDRVPPESLPGEINLLKEEFLKEKEEIEAEMEKKIEAIYQQST
jgi:hypothetical protein